MVKVRGYRVELGEAEAALYQHEQIRETAVVPVRDQEGGVSLHAYVVAEGELSLAALERHRVERLPRYMVPERFEFRSVLPKTSTDKVDRPALQAAAEGAAAGA